MVEGKDVYVTFRAVPGHKPIVKGNGTNMWSAILVTTSYVRIEGLEVIGNNSTLTLADALKAYEDAKIGGEDWEPEARFNMQGIGVGENDGLMPHHVEIKDCIIHDFAGGGIQLIRADYVIIKGNTIYNNAWYTMYAQSGISIFQSFNFDNDTKTYRIVVEGNITHNNYTQVPWIVTRENSDGNGIIIDTNRETQMPISNNIIPYTGRVLVKNNVSYDNGGGGIVVYQSDNVDVVNNSTYGNGKVMKYPEISFNRAANCSSLNNITYAREGIDAFSVKETHNVFSDFNIYYGMVTDEPGENDLNVDPEFTDLQNHIFTLKSHSPGIDTAGGVLMVFDDIAGNSRPQGKGHDRGAYEQTPMTKSSVTGGQ